MTCERIQIALSARLDGETTGDAHRLDGHLAGCAGCREWQSAAQRVTRLIRVQSVAVPDLTEPVLAAVAAEAPRSAASRAHLLLGWQTVLRLALAAAALGQIVVALPALLAGVNVTGDPHLNREMASFDVALAVGFALAAWRPQRVRAVLPVALVLAGLLAATSAMDIVQARALPWNEMGHLATVIQAGLLWALSRTVRGDAAVPATRAAPA
ncbi:zf-HC2 domain-containing protein [Pilimelia columellifera]|uniref:Zf-HC2 domain-containing protein n=1 Tax=Pilimelia columellifera subsp. columellifera TaxID=706583 RepID=A0ABP6AU26_9ACTN